MPNELPLPEELKHLLEKRTGKDRRNPQQSQEKPPKPDRRKSPRRKEDPKGRK